MKKSLLALAVLGAFAGAASAQSSVTIYGMVDLALAKQIGSEDNQVWDSPDSRIGFRGTEDLGGGLKGIFQFEHRFNAATGENEKADGRRMWHAISMVGLSGNWGTFGLGRQYNAAWPVTNAIDPWGDDTVAGLRAVGVLLDVDGTDYGTEIRLNNSVRYDSPKFGGFTFAAEIAEGNGRDDTPYSLSAVYAAGPLWLGIGHENQGTEADLTTIGAKYKFGAFGVSGGYSFGSGDSGEDIKSWMLAGTWDVGSGQVRVGYAESDSDFGDVRLKKAGLGYHHNLSKRTEVYADIAQGNSTLARNTNGDEDEDIGYGVGLRHRF
jgi:predicted porin